MERKKYNKEQLAIVFLIIIYTVGTLGHSFAVTLPLMQLLTPFTLAITGAVVYYFSYKKVAGRFIEWIALTFILTLIIEIVGVNTGAVFGNYDYGNTLGFKIIGTPVMIGVNWVFVILGAYNLAERSFTNKFAVIIVTALLAVIFDFVIEPMAIKLDYWSWQDNIIPLQNYLAWFLFSLILAFVAIRLKLRTYNLIPGIYFVMQFVFFFILNFTV